jgi:hypothetical protein
MWLAAVGAATRGRRHVRSIFRITYFVSSILLIAGCAANPYKQFYRGNPDGRTVDNYIAPTGPLEIYATDNFNRDVDAMEKRGFVPVGSSDFNGASNKVSEDDLREQAEKLGAAAVLVSSHYTHTVSGAMPLMLPNTSTSVTNGNATVYGPGGSANVYGSATTTTYGTETVMLPYNIQRSDFSAVYFVKRRARLGVMYGTIDATTRARLQTNAGVLIKVVVDGSAAARADILPGDIILAIDGERVDGNEALSAMLKERVGHEIVLDIDRNGTHVKKTVTPAL